MHRILFGITTLAVAGCSIIPRDADVDWSHGAKHGWVTELYSSATPRQKLPVCLGSLSPAELDQHHFARISYRHVRVMLLEVGELPEGAQVKIGDEVELWPSDCDKGLLSRISRVMPKDM